MGEFFEDPDQVIEAATLVAKLYESLLDIQTNLTFIVTAIAEALQDRAIARNCTGSSCWALNNPLPSSPTA